jgi:cbb3-type cytochrome oxidase maturation protein
MNVIPLLVVCSLFLALCGVGLFVWATRNGDLDHADRLSLLPLEEESNSAPSEKSR